MVSISERKVSSLALLGLCGVLNVVGCGGATRTAEQDDTSTDTPTTATTNDGDTGDGDGDEGDGDTGDGDAGDGDSGDGDGDEPTEPGAPCSPEGASGKVDCNTCTCSGGRWLCTEIACGLTCDPDAAPEPGCNPCRCVDGLLVCTDLYCPPSECTDGEVKPAEDGCNTCTCSGGSWGCTKIACPAPQACGGWLGDTCAPTEYCAYEPGQHCGAADASSVCQPRPEGCLTIDEPVCGCDGKSYSNACLAAMAGTGVNSEGACSTQTE